MFEITISCCDIFAVDMAKCLIGWLLGISNSKENVEVKVAENSAMVACVYRSRIEGVESASSDGRNKGKGAENVINLCFSPIISGRNFGKSMFAVVDVKEAVACDEAVPCADVTEFA